MPLVTAARNPAGRTAFVFPGQGAQQLAMLRRLSERQSFASRYEVICDCCGIDLFRDIRAGKEQLLNQNLCSSLLTVLASALALDTLSADGNDGADFVAGYSIGQWSAIYAAGMISYENLIRTIVVRARFMDECTRDLPGAMSAVSGVREQQLESLLAELRAVGQDVFIANYNCVGQYSIAGALPALELAEARIRALKPRRITRLPVSGAWHSPMLAAAERSFRQHLQRVVLNAPCKPIIDNVTGSWLASGGPELLKSLAQHLSHPVRWEYGIRRLISAGCTQFVEMGYGNSLSKFGFFIDRDVEHRCFGE